MHSRVYYQRLEAAIKSIEQAVVSLTEKGLIEASPMPADRDPRIQELFRLEYAANALEQLDKRLSSVPPVGKDPAPKTKNTGKGKSQRQKDAKEQEPPAPEIAEEKVPLVSIEEQEPPAPVEKTETEEAGE